MAIMKEAKTLTFGDTQYVVVDAEAREKIAELEQLVDCNINPTTKTDSMTQPVGVDSEGKLWTEPSAKSGSGISATAANLLIKILKSAQYSENQTANILTLEVALLLGENGEVEPPDNGVEQVGNILAISSGVSVSQAESVLIIV